jgi:phospholipid transport system substrate-binding protein
MRALLTAIALLAAAGSPTEALKARDAEIRAALPPPGREASAAERARVEKIVTRTVDLRAMAEAALGERWKKMTEKQRKRLVGAFEKRFRQAYGSDRLDSLRTTKIEYQPEQEGDGGVKVPTRVVVEGEPTQIIYTMRQERDGWRIVDIAVDGVSTVENYRSSFGRVIAKEGVDGLIQRLEKGPTGRS